MKNNIILINIGKLTSPLIIFFGLYILTNGEDSPGGGFQAGAIFASNIIILDMLGLFQTTSLLKKILLILSPIGILLYASLGIISIYYGYNFLDYSVLSSDVLYAEYLGIFIIEIGISITVSSVLSLLYFSFKFDSEYVQ
jgi:multicomponent Na+:H+ antiporter subunit B